MEFIIELIGALLWGFNPKSRMEKNIEKLKQEQWFLSLLQDYRYEYILFHNKKVKRILSNNKMVGQLLSHEHERERFIALVEQEHQDYVKLG